MKLEQSLRKLRELSKVSWDEYIKDEGIRDRAESPAMCLELLIPIPYM